MTVRIVNADVLAGLATLPDESVHMCVTSPPYFGLRDYEIPPQVWSAGTGLDCIEHEWDVDTVPTEVGGGNWAQGRNGRGELQAGGVDVKREPVRAVAVRAFCRLCGAWRGSLGLEPTVDLYVEHMVAVFREVRRVLRSDGVMFLNIGDSYAGSWGAQGRRVTESDEPSWHSGQIKNHPKRASGTGSIRTAGLKPKDLIGVPWMLAFALRADGWWLRSEITWAKRAPMPESCTDRATSATEKVFLLAKSGDSTYWTHRDHAGSRLRPAPDYRWVDRDNGDAETDVEPENWRSDRKRWRRINLWSAHDYFYDAEAVKEEAESDHPSGNGYKRDPRLTYSDANGARGNDKQWSGVGGKRNQRNFWLLGPEPFPEAHFATFVSEIPRRAILAGTSERGVCPVCGAPWARVVDKSFAPQANVSAARGIKGAPGQKPMDASNGWEGVPRGTTTTETLGWRPTCDCDAGNPVPATVLEPFAGAFTTCLVAEQLRRNSIGIDLNPEYCEMGRRRLAGDAPLFFAETA